jgi:D-alanyl-D-alanine carboxypeptidase
MKILILSILMLPLSYSWAQTYGSLDGAFEDTAEFLAPHEEKNSAPETWSYVFELVNPDGTISSLTSQNNTVLLKPASTMKIFSAWWAFEKNFRSDAYLSQMLKQSVNAMADETVQNMGGVLALTDYYRDLGLIINDETFRAADGSGLSYENKTTCETEVALLKLIKANKNYERFKQFLARPKQTGTLQNRLSALAGKLFAKTGTLNRTASLAGFVETKRGTMIFCILSDYLSIPVAEARVKIDGMVTKQYALLD